MSHSVSPLKPHLVGADVADLSPITAARLAIESFAAEARTIGSICGAMSFLTSAAAALSPVGRYVLGNDGVTQTSIHVVHDATTDGNGERVVTPGERARPPTPIVLPVACDTPAGARATIHDCAFKIRKRRIAFGTIPDSRVGTPAEMYSVRRSVPEAVIIPEIERQRHRLSQARRRGRPDLGKVIPALLDDYTHSRLVSYVQFPLLGPPFTTQRAMAWLLIGHVCITSNAPAAPSASPSKLPATTRHDLRLLLASLTEIVMMAFPASYHRCSP